MRYFCADCGKELTGDDLYCQSCGSVYVEAISTYTVEEEQEIYA